MKPAARSLAALGLAAGLAAFASACEDKIITSNATAQPRASVVKPATTRTRPFGRSVAVWFTRLTAIGATENQVLDAGL